MDVLIGLHDAAGGGWQFAIWQRVLAARGVRLHAPDLHVDDGAGFDAYRRHARDQCAGARAPVVIGIGLGGLLALSLATECAAAALVLINPLPPAGWRDGMPPLRAEAAAMRSLRDTCRALPDADDATRLLAFRRQRPESARVLQQVHVGIAVAVPTCPVLLLASSDDREVPSAVTRALALHLRADLEGLPGCSHLGPLLGQQAANIAERSVDWLSRQISPPDSP